MLWSNLISSCNNSGSLTFTLSPLTRLLMNRSSVTSDRRTEEEPEGQRQIERETERETETERERGRETERERERGGGDGGRE